MSMTPHESSTMAPECRLDMERFASLWLIRLSSILGVSGCEGWASGLRECLSPLEVGKTKEEGTKLNHSRLVEDRVSSGFRAGRLGLGRKISD